MSFGGRTTAVDKIWGDLVPYGMSDLASTDCASCPWRAGANENTTITHDARGQVQGWPPATYGLHMIPGQDEWTVIFSRTPPPGAASGTTARTTRSACTTKAAKDDYHEWLTYGFTEARAGGRRSTAALEWEKRRVPLHRIGSRQRRPAPGSVQHRAAT